MFDRPWDTSPKLRLPTESHDSARPSGDDALRISFDRIADRYDETRAYADGVSRLIAEALDEELTTDCTILEVGVGTGRTGEPLRAHGFDIVGVDISTGMLSHARSKGFVDVALADAITLPFIDDAFDHVLSVHVTHLISEWRTALSEMARVASEKIVSIVTEREDCDTEAMRRAYEGFCADAGHAIRHPGMMESELAEVIMPVRKTILAENVADVDTTDAIARYRERTFSDLWNVPDEVHERAVKSLEERYAGVERLERRERIVMMVWTVRDIEEFVARRGQ
ncbi:MAG TPA: class I SAM-dependent methyltransferase [Thermoplasmata archaeon]|nr:class I SAM-dependent methyltransferase [Thermoplasmata archaeon]